MTKSLRQYHFSLILIFLIPVLFASLGIVIWKGPSNVDFGDGQDYLRSARSIFSPSGYLRDGLTWPFFRPPGYPFVIASIWNLIGAQSILILKLLNVVTHLISTFLTFKILTRKYQSRVGVVGALIFGLNPFVLLPLTEIQTEPLTLMLFLLFCYLITSSFSPINTAIASLTSILLVAVRPEYFFIVSAICLIALLGQKNNSRSGIRIGAILITLVVSLSWWGLQNKEATGTFIPLTNASEYQLWNGSTEYIYNNYKLAFRYDPKFDSDQYLAIQNDIETKIENWGPAYTQGTLGDRAQLWRTAYLQNFGNDPWRYILKTFEKAAIFWRPFLNPRSHGLVLSFVSSIILLPLTFGIVIVLVRGRKLIFKDLFIKAYLVGFLGLTGIHALQMPDQRYKLPLLIPFASILIAPALSNWLTWSISKVKFFHSNFRFGQDLK